MDRNLLQMIGMIVIFGLALFGALGIFMALQLASNPLTHIKEMRAKYCVEEPIND